MRTPEVTNIVTNPIITTWRAISSSTRAIAEKSMINTALISRAIKEALGIGREEALVKTLCRQRRLALGQFGNDIAGLGFEFFVTGAGHHQRAR